MTFNSYTISFKGVEGIDEVLFNVILSKMKNQKYDENLGYGFFVEDYGKNYILSYLIIDSPTYINKFYSFDSSIKKINYVKQSIIKFLIDSKNSLIEVYSDKNNTTKVVNEIGKLSEYKIVSDDINFNLCEILNKLERQKIQFEIKNLRIRDFPLTSCSVGTYFGNISENKEGIKLINKYQSSVSYIGLSIFNDNKNTFIGIHETGSVRIYCSPEDSQDLLPQLKTIFFNGG